MNSKNLLLIAFFFCLLNQNIQTAEEEILAPLHMQAKLDHEAKKNPCIKNSLLAIWHKFEQENGVTQAPPAPIITESLRQKMDMVISDKHLSSVISGYLQYGQESCDALHGEQLGQALLDCNRYDVQETFALEKFFNHSYSAYDLPQIKFLHNFKNEENKTPLHFACEVWSEKEITEYLKKYFHKTGEVWKLNQRNLNSLISEYQEWSCANIQQLLDKGAVVDSFDDDAMTPLMYAYKYNNIEFARILKQHGANINPHKINIDKYGFWSITKPYKKYKKIGNQLCSSLSPLHWAVFHNNIKEVKSLILAGANTRIICSLTSDDGTVSDDHKTSLQIAVQNKYYKIAKLLLENGANPNDEGTQYILHDAVENADLKMIKLLLSYKADVNVRNVFLDVHPTHYCFLYRKNNHGFDLEDKNKAQHEEFCLQALTELINAGADINKPADEDDFDSKTILEFAFEVNMPTVVDFLLSKGAEHGRLYCILASSQKYSLVPLLKIFKQHGGDINQLDENLRTVLHAAVHKNDVRAMRDLLACGADSTIKDSNGCTAYDYAKTNEMKSAFSQHCIDNLFHPDFTEFNGNLNNDNANDQNIDVDIDALEAYCSAMDAEQPVKRQKISYNNDNSNNSK